MHAWVESGGSYRNKGGGGTLDREGGCLCPKSNTRKFCFS